MTVAADEIAAALIAYNPVSKGAAKGLLKTHEALCDQLSQCFTKCQSQITTSSHITAPNNSLWSEADKCPELPVLSPSEKQTCPFGCFTVDPLRCLHQCRWTRGGLFCERQPPLRVCCAIVAKHNRRGSLKVEWRCFVPDYYNLPFWRSEPGLWSGPSEATECTWEMDSTLRVMWLEQCLSSGTEK